MAFNWVNDTTIPNLRYSDKPISEIVGYANVYGELGAYQFAHRFSPSGITGFQGESNISDGYALQDYNQLSLNMNLPFTNYAVGPDSWSYNVLIRKTGTALEWHNTPTSAFLNPQFFPLGGAYDESADVGQSTYNTGYKISNLTNVYIVDIATLGKENICIVPYATYIDGAVYHTNFETFDNIPSTAYICRVACRVFMKNVNNKWVDKSANYAVACINSDALVPTAKGQTQQRASCIRMVSAGGVLKSTYDVMTALDIGRDSIKATPTDVYTFDHSATTMQTGKLSGIYNALKGQGNFISTHWKRKRADYQDNPDDVAVPGLAFDYTDNSNFFDYVITGDRGKMETETVLGYKSYANYFNTKFNYNQAAVRLPSFWDATNGAVYYMNREKILDTLARSFRLVIVPHTPTDDITSVEQGDGIVPDTTDETGNKTSTIANLLVSQPDSPWFNPSKQNVDGEQDPEKKPAPPSPEPEPEDDPNKGNYDKSIDTITPALSTIGLFNTYYAMTYGEVNDFASWLWNVDKTEFDTIAEGAKLQNNPMDCLISLRMYPFDIEQADPNHVSLTQGLKFGRTPCPSVTAKVIDGAWKCILDFGNLYVYPSFKSFLDYEPYTDVTIYLPYIGRFSLSTQAVMGKTLSVKYIVDIITGATTARIYTIDNQVAVPIMEVDGYIGNEISMSAESTMNYLLTKQNNEQFYGLSKAGNIINTTSNIASNALGMGMALATDNPMGAVASGLNMFGSVASGAIESKKLDLQYQTAQATNKASVSKTSASSPVVNNFMPQRPYLIIEKPIDLTPTNYGSTIGYAVNQEKNIVGNYGEHMTIMNPKFRDLEDITRGEYEELVSILTGNLVHFNAERIN